jgi:hypothetical protein
LSECPCSVSTLQWHSPFIIHYILILCFY